MGLKLIVVCALALLMLIPALFVWALINDRTSRESDVIREIGNQVGGQQTFLGPVLALPYSIPAQSPSSAAKEGQYLVFPVSASAGRRPPQRSDTARSLRCPCSRRI